LTGCAAAPRRASWLAGDVGLQDTLPTGLPDTLLMSSTAVSRPRLAIARRRRRREWSGISFSELNSELNSGKFIRNSSTRTTRIGGGCTVQRRPTAAGGHGGLQQRGRRDVPPRACRARGAGHVWRCATGARGTQPQRVHTDHRGARSGRAMHPRARRLPPPTDARVHPWLRATSWCGVAAGGAQAARLRIVAPGAHTLLNFGRQCVCAVPFHARVRAARRRRAAREPFTRARTHKR
jgi:hypothetical protein